MKLSELPLNGLKVFEAVARTRSMTAAAADLNVVPSAVSQHLARLEAELGIELIQRHGRTFTLTEEGEAIRRLALPHLEQILEALGAITRRSAEPSGRVRVATLREFGEGYLAGWLMELAQTYPLLQIQLLFLGQAEILESLRSGDCDIGVGLAVPVRERLRSYRLASQRILVVTGRGSHSRFEATAKTPLVSYRDKDPVVELYLKSKSRKFHSNAVQPRFMASSHEVLCQYLAKNTNHWAALPEWSQPVQRALGGGDLRVLATLSKTSDLFVHRIEQRRPPERIRIVESAVRKRGAELKASVRVR